MEKNIKTTYNGFEIAVIGMSGRFPGAGNIEEFWCNLKNGKESITFLDDEYLRKIGVDSELLENRNYVKACSCLNNVEYFDASFFGYSPKEAAILNPQTRIFYECVYEALEDAGYASDNYNGLIGLYAGASINLEWEVLTFLSGKSQELGQIASTTLANKDSLCTRISYKLNLKGPSISLRTACSTSLVALHTAYRALLTKECDIALAGGISIQHLEKKGYLYQEGLILSSDGHCRPFDSRANGTIFGDGAGVVVLKKHKNAIKDGDNIYALIKGSAINNDGSRKVGYTAPSVEGQADVIISAQKMAGVEPGDIGYIETHGTGTSVGDIIEIEAMKLAFKTGKRNFCCLGLAKSNIGHLDSAAGIAGFIKTVMVLKHKLIPPAIHFQSSHPDIDLANSPFYINKELKEWKTDQYPLRAGVSSFGLGGTNAHVILEEAPIIQNSTEDRHWKLLTLSAKTSSALDVLTNRLILYFQNNPAINLADAAYTLQVGRSHFKYRKAFISSTINEAVEALTTQDLPKVNNGIFEGENRSVIFMFSGLGSQYVNMGLELYQKEKIFKAEMDRCFAILKPLMNYDLKEILYPSHSSDSGIFISPAESQTDINQPEISQPIIFIFEYALATLLIKWGIKPHAMIGYSFGEYVAACISGIFSLEYALSSVVYRSKLIQTTPPGSMLSVPLTAAETASFLNSELSIAIDNGTSCIVAGSDESIVSFEKKMKEKKLICVRVPSSRAIHSKMMGPILNEFEQFLDKLKLNKPKIPFVSNVTGKWSDDEEIVKPAYWVKHLMDTVQFSAGMKELFKENNAIFIQIGPGQDLGTLALRYIKKESNQKIIPLVRHPSKNISDLYFLLNKMAKLWIYGIKLDWLKFYGEEKRFRISLPTYSFERQRYWIDYNLSHMDITLQDKITQSKERKNLFYIPSWKPSPFPVYSPNGISSGTNLCWLMFIDESNFSFKILKHLLSQGETVFCVKKGTEFKKKDDFNYTINYRIADNYDMLLRDLHTNGLILRTIVHLWGITDIHSQELNFENVKIAQEIGLYSLLYLAQAIESQGLNDINPIQIKIITNNMQRLPGEEIICPEKSPVLAAVKMIRHVYSNIACCSIDISIPTPGTWQEVKFIDRLVVELKHEYSEMVITYRGNDRMVQGYEPLELRDSERAAFRLKDNGVYLIVGNIKGISLELAEFIMRKSHAKAILIENPVSFFKYEQQDHLSIDINKAINFLDEIESKIEKELDLIELDSFVGVEKTLNELCSSYILDFFKRNSICIEAGRIYEKEKLKNQLRVLPKFDKFFNFFIKVLAEDRIINVKDNNLEILGIVNEVQEPKQLAEVALKKYPEFSGTLNLLEHCTAHYSKALCGDINAVEVLFPNGRNIKSENESIDAVQYSKERLYILLLRELLSYIIKKISPQKTVKILEIGAGDGVLTREIIPLLKDQNVEYHFTDIGNSFVLKAQKEAVKQGLNFMKFKIFDISKDIKKEGYDEYSFDIILGLNVVHMVKYIKDALWNLKKLLVPNGVIALIEITEPKRWRHLINGLAEGWWLFDDSDLREETSLLSLDVWEAVFKKVKFQNVYSFPLNRERKLKTNCGLIVAQQESHIGNSELSEEKHDINLESTGSTIWNHENHEVPNSNLHVIEGNTENLEELQELITRVKNKWGEISGVINCIGNMEIVCESSKASPGLIAAMCEPKMRSLLALETIFKDSHLDFFVTCSLMNTVDVSVNAIGNNAVTNFFNSFADHRLSSTGCTALSFSLNPGEEIIVNSLFDFIFESSFSQVILSHTKPKELHSQVEKYSKKNVESIENSNSMKYKRFELSNKYAPPRNDIEKALTDIWEEFLGMKPIGIDDDFLELGMDSLVFITIAGKIQKVLNVKVPISEFFTNNTIANLAVYIEGAKKEFFTSIEPIEKKEYYPLSAGQKGLFILYQLSPENTSYNITLLLQIEGKLDREKFEDTFRKIIRRHESLRTFFTIIDNAMVQRINDDVNFKFEYYDTWEDEELIKKFIRAFNLSEPPLLRVGLIKLAEEKYILMMDMHHIISDGISLRILSQDFTAFYVGQHIDPLIIQYKDYAQWQKQNLESNTESQLQLEEYWRGQILNNKEIPVLNLPTDFKRPDLLNFEGGRVRFDCTHEEYRQIITLAQEEGTTPYVVLLSVFIVFLSKISNQEAIVVGTLAGGRKHECLESLIGMFVNTLVLINFLEPHQHFNRFLKDVNKRTLNALDNQDYPFEKLVEKLILKKDPGRNPLFDVLFTLEPSQELKIEMPGLKLGYYNGYNNQTSQFDLTLAVDEVGEIFYFSFEYRTSLFEESTIQKFVLYFKKVLSTILADREILVKNIEILYESHESEINIFDDGLGNF